MAVTEKMSFQAQAENQKNIRRLEENLKKWQNIKYKSNTSDLFELKELARINPEKAMLTAQLMENFNVKRQMFDEATLSTQFGTRPENFLKLIRIGVANSFRGDFADEVALTSTDDAYYFLDRVYSSTARGATQGEFIYENAAPLYPSEVQTEVIDGTGAATSYAGTLSGDMPTMPYHTKVIVGGAVVAVDNGAGVLVGTTLTGTNTIDYTTGDYVLTFSAAPLASISIETNFNSELEANSSNQGNVDLSLRKIRFNVRPFSLGYSYSLMTSVFMDKSLGQKTEDSLLIAVADEMARARDFRAIRFMNQVAKKNTEETFDANFATFGSVDYIKHAQRIVQKFDRIEDRVYNDTHRGELNVILATPSVVSYLRLHDKWKDSSITAGSKIGVYPVGEVAGKKVFKVPVETSLGLVEGDAILTMKSGISDMDTGVIFGTLSEAETKLTYPDGTTSGRMFAMEDSREINGKFLRRLHISNIDSSF